MQQKPNYYAVIPANVRYDKTLPPRAILLYGEISALCNEKGYCWASNNYFSSLYSVSKNTITNLVKALSKSGHITTEIRYKEGSKEILGRYIKIVGNPTQNILGSPTQKNCGDNNTSSNTTNNKYDSKIISLYNDVIKLFPKELHPSEEKSADEWKGCIEKLCRIDGQSPEKIIQVVKFARTSDFWSKNFLSILKLRRKNKEKVQYFDVFLNQIGDSNNTLEPNYKKWLN